MPGTPPIKPGKVEEHADMSASAAASAAPTTRAGQTGDAEPRSRGLGPRKGFASFILDCRDMAKKEIEDLVNNPTEEQKQADGFNFQGNQNLTDDLFLNIFEGPQMIIVARPNTLFQNARRSKCNVEGTNLTQELLAESKHWALSDEMWETFMPTQIYEKRVFGHLRGLGVSVRDETKDAFMTALRDNQYLAEKIEDLELCNLSTLTQDECVEIASNLKDIKTLSLPDHLDMPNLKHCKSLENVEYKLWVAGDDEIDYPHIATCLPEGCKINNDDVVDLCDEDEDF